MKRLVLVFLSSLLLFACTTTMDRKSQHNLIGTWKLDKVNYSESMVRVQAFGEFDAKCLENSSWFFVSNNNTGNMTLNGTQTCPTITQKFTWFIDPQGMFILKLLDQTEKARKVITGTVYQFQPISDSEFNLSQTIDGVKITYHFMKLSSKKMN